MSIPDEFAIKEIHKGLAKPWIKDRHYARRTPPIKYSYGLYKNNILVGVATFGNSYARVLRDKWPEKYEICEFNRLITEDDLRKNALSYFVSQCLKKLPQPMVIVSYADSNQGHHGYIYQATNWIYTGKTEPRRKFIDENGNQIHERTMVNKYGSSSKKTAQENNINIKTQEGKYRYFYFIGNKRQKRKMKKYLDYKEKPYPKGENEKYDIGDDKQRQSGLGRFED